MEQAKVLVVDDEPSTVALLHRLLTREGYAVIGVTIGADALPAIHRERPDLVLLDVLMPGLDGLEICRRIKAEPATHLLPVVLVTGTRNRVAGIDAGADEFLTKPFDPHELLARVRSPVRLKRYTDELDSAEAVLLSLALTIEARDPYTEGHCQRLAQYASSLGRRLSPPEHEQAALRRGAYLHDIGKVGVPDAIFFKADRLTPEEFEVMKQHPVIGDRLCGELRILEPVRPIVRSHHERLDGSGYPDALRGSNVPLPAQILAIVDVYDALTTTRSYRATLPMEQACDELKQESARNLHDSSLIGEFLSLAKSGGLTLSPGTTG